MLVDARRPRPAWRLLILVLLAAACGREARESGDQYLNILPFDTARVRVASASDTATLTVELAESEEQRALGLMERRALAEDAGMLFLFPDIQPESSGFWMFRTRIPLDIAFVDDSGVIRAIRAMAPCTSDLVSGCPSYPAGAPYRAALEVNPGYFARRGLGIGARVFLQDTVTRRRSAGAR